MDSPRALGETLFQQLELFRGRSRNDDETLLVLQREEESLLSMLGEVASSNTFGRLRRSPEKSQPEIRRSFGLPAGAPAPRIDPRRDFTIFNKEEAVCSQRSS